MKAKENQIMIVEDFSFDAPKTSQLNNILKALKLDSTKTLILLGAKNENVYKSGRNMAKCSVIMSELAATYELLDNKMIVMQKSAVDTLCKSLS